MIGYLAATGDRLKVARLGKVYCAKAGATTTAVTIAAASTFPVGSYFFLDNSNGSGSLTCVPDSGSTITVTTGKVFRVQVAASGVFKSLDMTA